MPGQSELMHDIPGIHPATKKTAKHRAFAAAASVGAALALAPVAAGALPDSGQIQRHSILISPGQIQHPSWFRPFPGQIQHRFLPL